mmetsp:Transcript_11216/g.21373  ORF Transcript_11216/g.21373 Transcript_11216/m.21373 type:complete len:270 (+) Transcript_11216:1639-2448(+)
MCLGPRGMTKGIKVQNDTDGDGRGHAPNGGIGSRSGFRCGLVGAGLDTKDEWCNDWVGVWVSSNGNGILRIQLGYPLGFSIQVDIGLQGHPFGHPTVMFHRISLPGLSLFGLDNRKGHDGQYLGQFNGVGRRSFKLGQGHKGETLVGIFGPRGVRRGEGLQGRNSTFGVDFELIHHLAGRKGKVIFKILNFLVARKVVDHQRDDSGRSDEDEGSKETNETDGSIFVLGQLLLLLFGSAVPARLVRSLLIVLKLGDFLHVVDVVVLKING